jgi:Raf kinase inhibitor-like YbhB/YbcL family protein
MMPAFPLRSITILFIVIISKFSFLMPSNPLTSKWNRISQLKNYICLVLSSFAALLLISSEPAFANSPALLIHSEDFTGNEPIPVAYTCSGENRSPQLSWSGMPAATKTLALIVRDPDAPIGSYVHWVLFDLPANVSGLPEAVPALPSIAQGGMQGRNGSGKIGYQGPCPPPGPTHHYHFRLYALDRSLNLTPDATAAEVEAALAGHVVAAGELVGTFAR